MDDVESPNSLLQQLNEDEEGFVMCRRRKKPGTVANQIMRRLPPDLLAQKEKPLRGTEGPKKRRGKSHEQYTTD